MVHSRIGPMLQPARRAPVRHGLRPPYYPADRSGDREATTPAPSRPAGSCPRAQDGGPQRRPADFANGVTTLFWRTQPAASANARAPGGAQAQVDQDSGEEQSSRIGPGPRRAAGRDGTDEDGVDQVRFDAGGRADPALRRSVRHHSTGPPAAAPESPGSLDRGVQKTRPETASLDPAFARVSGDPLKGTGTTGPTTDAVQRPPKRTSR